jgi:predicted chitinase
MNPSIALTAPIGPGQPNTLEDLQLVRRYLNRFITAGYLPELKPIPELGGWTSEVASALQAIENRYFFGEADPNNRIETNDTLFQFLVGADLSAKQIAATLSPETYALAEKMVPGGADWTKRTTLKTKVVVNGKTTIQKEVKKEKVAGRIRTYLPDILQALRDLQLNDTDMLMMALGTVRAESAGFRPIDEGISKYNTNDIDDKVNRKPFDKYDGREALGNTEEGDGALYKGRGFVQLTGRSIYKLIGSQIGTDLEANPDLANDPQIAAKTLARFLKNKEKDVRTALVGNNLAKARKLVNGGSHGLQEFIEAFKAGRAYLGIVVPPKAKAAAKSAKTAKAAQKPKAPTPPRPKPPVPSLAARPLR